ncbi:hypothetical protein GMPD_27720 [Geomonas paludis]|uniref:Uncharacterized protein n=1 Tax=Geomonas paludis TaxID=2740185 RepID=A0A6V8MZA9_9BACT|nr:hypothetical protein GMPD_27720 [Geomonas paludis]
MSTPTTAARSKAGRQPGPPGGGSKHPREYRLPNRHKKQEEAA